MGWIWHNLLAKAPEIRELRDDCISIAKHAKSDWYIQWLGPSPIFTNACRLAAKRLSLDEAEIRAAVSAELISLYYQERRGKVKT